MVWVEGNVVSPVSMKKQNNGASATQNNNLYDEAVKIAVAKDGAYVTGIALNREGTNFAVSTSNMEIQCFSVEKQSQTDTYKGCEKPISRIKYSNESPYLLYTSCLDGIIRLWDVRAKTKNSPARQYFDDTDGKLKPLSTFDISLNELYVCGATELIREDSYLIFWDQRMATNLGGYWNGHTDDITQVKYHSYKNCAMATGSTDGLINVYDLSQHCEEDALIYTLNTGSSVANIAWNTDENHQLNQSQLACITHTEELQLWSVDDASPRVSLGRKDLQSDAKVQVDYLVDTLTDDYGSAYLITGQRNGSIQMWTINGRDVTLCSSFSVSHTDDVRAVTWNPSNKMMFTGGEDGLVCIWKCRESETPSTNYKMQSHLKNLSLKRQKKPY